ncbi:glycosyltransferase family 2 protein [Nonomuraea sp. NBC_01738]|uniref:glycosyltransferase family 2 protein n=1 Tax=Nonomuraea sp. NBC_01738 TaxID=2976003 RepID=UPI002E10C319|nr:glycosyltransferase family 2 protein [Nonomuraea sp. NBC_01738]
MPRGVAVVIVTYNSADVLAGCLESLAGGAAGVRLSDVVVADNASKDDSVAIAKAADGVRVVEVGRNAGYAAAINAGLDALDLGELDAVYVINPDCRLRPGSILPLARVLDDDRRGIAVPYMVNPDGSLQPSLRRMPAIGRAVVEALIGGIRAGRIGTLGELVTDPRDYARAREVAWATGAAMLMSARMLRELGPWDETFLLYSEETEYCLRAADHGWATYYEPASVIEHIGGDSAVNPTLAALLIVNKVTLFRRRRGPLAGTVYYLVVLAGEAARALTGRATSRRCVSWLLRPSLRMRSLPG